MTPVGNDQLRIGSVRVNAALDEIERDGQVIKLEPRAMRLLVYLAQHAGEVVTVEQLLDEVWKDVVVSHDSVYQVVARLRRVLGDDPKNPTYIANVIRRGYRLIAPVSVAGNDAPLAAAPVVAGSQAAEQPVGPAPAPAGVPAGVPVPAVGSRRPAWMFALIAVVALGGLIALYDKLHRRRTAELASPGAVVVQDISVAVVPFVDASAGRDQEYFADGLTEAIIDLLAKVPGLRVPARTSSFYFKGKSSTVKEIAQSLGVANLLEGSVRRIGDDLRITTELIRADNGYQVWSENYDLRVADVLAIQDDIAAAVVRSLKAVMFQAQNQAPMSGADAEAYTAVLRARFLRNRGSDGDNRDAVSTLERAVAIDPTYAAAWGELAEAYRERSSFFDETPDKDIDLARADAARALALDPRCVAAHDALADIALFYDFDPLAAAREIQALRAADPTRRIHDANPFYSGCVTSNCYEQVLRDAQDEIAGDPLNPSPYSTRALARYVFGDLDGAERDVRRALTLSPASGYRRYMLVRILVARHDRAALAQAIADLPDSLYGHSALALALHALGRTEEAQRALQSLVTHESKEGAYQIAQVYAARGELDCAMQWLERAYAQHDSGLWTLQIDPLLRPLSADARFLALKARLKM